MSRAKRRRVVRFICLRLGVKSPSQLPEVDFLDGFIEGFVEAMAQAELIAGWDLTESLPRSVPRNS